MQLSNRGTLYHARKTTDILGSSYGLGIDRGQPIAVQAGQMQIPEAAVVMKYRGMFYLRSPAPTNSRLS